MARTHQQPPPSKNPVVEEIRNPHRKQEGERSKNRPTISRRTPVGFGGYHGSSRIEPASSSSEESTSFSDVDGEVSQHLKKLGRKDPTTKLKALASLCLLFKKKSGEELAQIVPQWAFEYKRLVLDYNREVRWGTHDAMTSLVTTVGFTFCMKDLVPHLTSLMGPWWFAQFDPIIEVSQAAKRSLEENTSTATNQVNTQAGPGASVTVEKDLVSQAEKRTWRLFLARMYFHHSFRMLRSILVHSKIWYVMGIGEAEAFSERLKRELLALETDNVHALLENEPLVEEIESRNNKLELQSVSNKVLIEELDRLLEKLNFPPEFAACLTGGSLDEVRGVKCIEACEWLTGALRGLGDVDICYERMRAMA